MLGRNEVQIYEFRVADIVEDLKRNMAAAMEIYEEALISYRKESETKLKSALRALRDGELIGTVSLPLPMNRKRDYEKAIAFFEGMIADTVKLTQGEFDVYVNDDWGWKQEFLVSNRLYSAKAELASRARN